MHLLIKGYYGYKNLGDELILFSLITWVEETFHPDQISLIAGNPLRLEDWLTHHKDFFPPILQKLKILPNPNSWEYVQHIL
jgi:polysaccharide pyruvyl transferase WcaK-like protein